MDSPRSSEPITDRERLGVFRVWGTHEASVREARRRARAAYDRGFNGEMEEEQLDGFQSCRLARLWEGRYRE